MLSWLLSGALSLLLSLLFWLAVILVVFGVFVSVVNWVWGSEYRAAVSPSREDPMELVKRNLHFYLEKTPMDDVAAWNGNGRFVSLFMAALSLFFPAGERMFVRAVQQHQQRPEVQADAKLKEACANFVSQEAVHGREHDYYNSRLMDQYPIARSLERLVELICTNVTRFMPLRMQLSVTVALEHWTALMGGFLLQHQEGTFGSEEARASRFGLVWLWHACEETEHKAVAFDLYERVYGNGLRAYFGRCQSLLIASLIFWALVPIFLCALVAADGGLLQFGEWFKLFKVLWYRPGMLTRIVPAWCDYFRFAFHPWDHNNSEMIKQLPALEARLREIQAAEDASKKTKSVDLPAPVQGATVVPQ